MAIPIRMPDLGTTVETFPFMQWLVHEGDVISLGDPLAEIETDKAVAVLESPAKGTLLKQLVCAGDIVHTGDIVAYVGASGDVIAEEVDTIHGRDAHATGETVHERDAHTTPSLPFEIPALPVSSRPVLVSPMVRNLAVKLGVDLNQVQGTGQLGVITRDDVLRCSKDSPVTAHAVVNERLSRGQLAVARHVLKSWTEIPHLYISASIDMTAAQQTREEQANAGVKISYDALILRALAQAIQALPLVASKLDGEQIIPVKGIHLALAIGIDNELFLPVIRDVEKKSLLTLQDEITNLVTQVKTKSLPAERFSGGCMAFSNLGMYPIDDFDPIIFPEHSAIIAVGAIQSTPVAVQGFLGIKPIMKVRLAVDHRLINGRAAAEFISKVKELLERGSHAI